MHAVRPRALVLALIALAVGATSAHGATPPERAYALVSRMTLQEELSLVGSGIDGVPRLGIPPLKFTDGPNGVGEGATGVTSFPTGINIGASFDPTLARRYGQALGAEAAGKGKTVIGAPTINLLRSPLWGRAAETFSEDPFLTSALVVPEIQGIQSQHIVAQVKHYAANNQEVGRFGPALLAPAVDVQVDARTLHEVYYQAFRAAVGLGGAGSVMCSYNRINGTPACENAEHLAALRTFGFEGFVEPDQTLAVRDLLAAAKAGVENFQLGSVASVAAGAAGGQGRAETKGLTDAVASGTLSRSVIDKAARNVLVGMAKVGLLDHPTLMTQATPSTSAHRRLATEISTDATVLLKNSAKTLPLSKVTHWVAVIGADASTAFQLQEGGSPAVRPGRKVITPLAGLRARAPHGTRVTYAPGTRGTVGLPVVPAGALKLTGTYYATGDFSGAPVATKAVTAIDFASTKKAPLQPIPGTNASSARFTGTLTPRRTGSYTFSLKTAGIAKLTVDGKPVASANTEFIDTGNLSPGAPPVVSQGKVSLRKNHRVKIDVEYATGLSLQGAELHLGWDVPNSRIAQAVAAAKKATVAVVFANDNTSEGMDRSSLALPGDQDRLISAVAAANRHTIVVLNTSGPVLMPWRNRVAAIVENWYPGQNGGTAIAKVLYGDANPGGRLPMTWPANAKQGATASKSVYPGTGNAAKYAEGLDIGYRYYDAHGQKPLYPFGYGLSYTTFKLGKATLRKNAANSAALSVPVTNTGKRSGAEVVQAYLTYPTAAGEPRQLKGIAKVVVAAGKTVTATITLGRGAFEMWGTATKTYIVTRGTYRVSVGTSSRDLAPAMPVTF